MQNPKRVEKFEFLIKNEKLKQYRLLAIWIVLLNLGFLLWLAFSNPILRTAAWLTTALVVVAIIFYFKPGVTQHSSRLLVIGMGLFVAFYSYASLWKMMVAVALLAVLFIIAIRRLNVVVSPDLISFPSFPAREVEWSEVNNIVLKDGLLTIDFRNNRLSQLTVIDAVRGEYFEEKVFNEFCQVQLKKVKTFAKDSD